MSNIKIMSLGGLGENGKNMTVVEVNNKIFILDAGMRYPDIDMYGVDLVTPNIDYLISHKQNIQGIFISHGHEENVGAIAYLLKQLHTKVYATNFTISIIEEMALFTFGNFPFESRTTKPTQIIPITIHNKVIPKK